MNNGFKDLKIIDNFFQTSCFIPLPLTLIGTLDESEEITSFGAYSLVFPYYVFGKDYYSMLLVCGNSSNTCKSLLRNGKCTINFLPYSKEDFTEAVRLGFPGEEPKDKMKDFKYTTTHGIRSEKDSNNKYPDIIQEAIQVFECTWVKELDNAQFDKVEEEYNGPYHNFNGITSKYGAHFILKIDNILIKEPYYSALVNGVNEDSFPNLPISYGFRDSKASWCSNFNKPISVGVIGEQLTINEITTAVSMLSDNVKFTEDALALFVNVPRPMLKKALMLCIDYANSNNVNIITKEVVEYINNKRKDN